MKQQVIVIHGGDTFDTYEEYLMHLKSREIDFSAIGLKKWKDLLGERLGGDFEVIMPMMPNMNNAKYLEWKIWFEKLIPFFRDGVIFVGHSLGGTFLMKYFSENTCMKKIGGIFIVAGAYESENKYSLTDFTLGNSFESLSAQVKNIYLYFSEDDQIVSFNNAKKFSNSLPGAKLKVFKDKGHFRLIDFPEIVDDIRNLATQG